MNQTYGPNFLWNSHGCKKLRQKSSWQRVFWDLPNSSHLRKSRRCSSRTPECCRAPSLFVPLHHPSVEVSRNLESFRLAGSRAYRKSSSAFLVCWEGSAPGFRAISGEQSLTLESKGPAVWILSTWVLFRIRAASGNCIVGERFFQLF